MIEIFTDGSAIKNPGPGGFGVVVLDHDCEEFSMYAFPNPGTTNNRMEMAALIYAISKVLELRRSARIFSDSNYCVQGYNTWMHQWDLHNDPTRKNVDLWRDLYRKHCYHRDLNDMPIHVDEKFAIHVEKIKAHDGNPGNEMADDLAGLASKSQEICIQENLPIGQFDLYSENLADNRARHQGNLHHKR